MRPVEERRIWPAEKPEQKGRGMACKEDDGIRQEKDYGPPKRAGARELAFPFLEINAVAKTKTPSYKHTTMRHRQRNIASRRSYTLGRQPR